MRVKIHKIHREGRGILIVMFLILALLNVASYFLIQTQWIFIVFLSLSTLLYLVAVNFFRSPRRVYPGYFNEEKDIIASADGVVVAVEEVMENGYFKDKRIQVSIFIAYSPTTGTPP